MFWVSFRVASLRNNICISKYDVADIAMLMNVHNPPDKQLDNHANSYYLVCHRLSSTTDNYFILKWHGLDCKTEEMAICVEISVSVIPQYIEMWTTIYSVCLLVYNSVVLIKEYDAFQC